ncbi:MAG: hypothetical protein H7X88_02590 [Gloeobacteraceae cyanobacterium ES-bin-316]|nr:hypothetical protein [Ferruginibacter sp.]
MGISNTAELRTAIQILESKKQVQQRELVDQFHVTVESLKPGNLIKSAIGNIVPVEVLGGILKTAGTVGVGLLTSKIVGGAAVASKGRGILSGLLSQTATRTVVNNMDTIKAYGTAIIQNLFIKKK